MSLKRPFQDQPVYTRFEPYRKELLWLTITLFSAQGAKAKPTSSEKIHFIASNVTVVAPVSSDGYLTIVQGDD